MAGIIGKALRGLGQGMAEVGRMSYATQQQERLERLRAMNETDRAKLIAEYTAANVKAGIASQEKMQGTDIAARSEEAQKQRGFQSEEAGKEREFKGGLVLKQQEFDRAARLSDWAHREDEKQLDRQLEERLKNLEIDARIDIAGAKLKGAEAGLVSDNLKEYRQVVGARFGTGLLEKFSEKERDEFEQLYIRGANQVASGALPYEAFNFALNSWYREIGKKYNVPAGVTGPGESSSFSPRRNFDSLLLEDEE